jgi:hypothetical protein
MGKLTPGGKMKLFMVVWLLIAGSIQASTYFVAPKGDDSGPGTVDQPFATLQKGHDKAAAGDTVFIRGGTYTFPEKSAKENCGVYITKSGESDAKRIYFWAYKNEVPVFDFADVPLTSVTGAGIRINGSKWLHFKGLEICNVPQPGAAANNGIWANPCSNTIFELMNFHHNGGPGLSIANGTGGNLILNCDAHDNYDAKNNGEDADGFGIHYQSTGTSTIYRGCRSWWNSDDGFDLFKQEYAVIMDNCWAYGNGYIKSGTGAGANGAGFKMGHTYNGARHVIKNCLAWKNRAQGFYANHSDCGSDWFNNTAYNNGSAFDMLSDSELSGSKIHKLRNNIAFPATIKNPGASDMQFNTWNLSITPAAGDFVTVSDSGWTGPRRPDGGLPDIGFMKLKQGGKMIDKGTDVGLPFAGEAPDLGAYEFGATTVIFPKPAPRESAPFAFHGNANGVRTIMRCDVAGRTLHAGYANRAFMPVIYYEQITVDRSHVETVIRVKQRGDF